MSRVSAMDFYSGISWSQRGFFAESHLHIDRALARRMCASYQTQIQSFDGFGNSLWGSITQKNREIHDALVANDVDHLAMLLSNPLSTNLFYGFDNAVGYIAAIRRSAFLLDNETQTLCDRIVRLAESVGASRLWYPEAHGMRTESIDLEAMLGAIDEKIGVRIEFPNPFPDEFGIQTSRGIACYRALQAIYQAWRLRVLSDLYGTQIVEIGAGLGRTAFYALRMGLRDYTIVDLPMTTVAQALFLACVLGPDALTLPGESPKRGCIRIETPASFLACAQPVDIVANIDSITEMDRSQAELYATAIVNRSRVFLSINHEINYFKVVDLAAFADIKPVRHPYWLRNGYVEELFVIPRAAVDDNRPRKFP